MWPFKKKKVILTSKKYIDYLPVGTIVRLHNDNSEYMIYRYLGNACASVCCNNVGLKQSHIYNQSEKIYYHVDYALSPYPFNNSSTTSYIMHEDIKEIVYMGYDDEYRRNILNDIDKWNQKKGDVYE